MVEEFDDVFEDDITTLTFTYADDVEIPEIPDIWLSLFRDCYQQTRLLQQLQSYPFQQKH